MSFRRVSSWLRTTSLVGCGLIGSAVSPLALGVAFPLGIDEAKGRWITYQSDAGETLYALSLMPRESQNRESLRVALVVDTSASQTGVVRRESMAMVESFLKSLSTETKVALWACDVKPVDLSGGLQSADSSNMVHALEALKMRTPLGTTDLGAALMAAQRSLGEASGGVVVYIGDGICRTNIWDDDRVAAIVEGMRAKQTSVVSMAIGPVCDVETLAVLANHSGGTVFVRSNIEKTPEEMGRGLAGAAEVEVFWPSEASLPSVISSHFPKLLPPLRGDRDSILVGQMNGKSGSGQVVLKGTMGGKPSELEVTVEAEASNPDLGFLRLVMAEVTKNDGLKMPTAGSPALRQLGVVLAKSADDLVRAGRFALQSGDAKVASEIAEEALKRDPNNEEASTLLEAAKQSIHQVTVDRGSKAKFRFVSFTKQPPNDDELGVPMDGQINVPQGGLDEFATGGDLLDAEDDLRRVVAGKMEREVADKLKKSRDLMRTDPSAAKQMLKQLQDTVLRVSELDPNLRTELNSKVSSAVQAASRQEVRVREQLAQQSQAQAAASGALALIAERRQREQTVQQLVERFNALMAEQNFMAANNDIAPVLHEIMRDEPIQRVVELESNMASNNAMIKDVIDRRWRGFVDVMYQIEASAIPISDEPPVVYPPRDQWERITALRQRFRSIDLASNAGPGERAIYNKLDQRINVDFRSDTTLSAAIETFKDIGIPIVLDLDEDSEITPDSAIEKVNFSGEVSVRSALRILLKPLELTYVIENEVMTITGKANAKTRTTKIYPVGDLVIPIMSGGMGGMGGGMGGGGMGGGGMGGMGGGGMGGMGGGGMGGMGGGGMGGMGGGGMGGMGGGMFAIQDPARKAARKETASTPVATASVSIQKQAEELIRQMESASEEERAELDKKLSTLVIGELKLANQNVKGKDVDGSTVHFQNILDVVNHALREGYPQPWMYEAMSISMQACEYPAEETRRVLLSAIDFSGDIQQAISIAKHFNKIGLKEDALQVLHDVVRSQPMLSEPYEMALPIAEELQDVSALQWVCSGILGQAWTDDKLPMIERAEVAAKAAYVRLQKSKRVIESQDFLKELENAVYRDAVVRVTWTGDCDIDLLVEEPSGSICSVSNPRTLAGGMLMGDGSPSNRSKDGLCSESYVCPQGFSGKYRIMVRKSWGEVGAGKVTAHILTDYKTPHQKYHTVQISLDEKDAMVEIEVKEGHRKSPVLESALAKVEQDRKKVVKNLTAGKNAVARSFSRSETEPEVNPVGQQNGNPRNGFGGNPVGYRPDITFLPDGVQMSVTAVISGDRRYVRVTPFPFFSAITDVTTFNFVSGAGGNGGGGGGGLGGGGGGFGGGGGGGMF